MADRKSKKAKEAPVADEFETGRDETPVVKERKSNPLEGAFLQSVNEWQDGAEFGQAMRVNVRDEDHAKKATALVKRAARELGYGVEILDYTAEGYLKFAAYGKRARKYTADDIRKHFADQGHDVSTLTPELREAYRRQTGQWTLTDAKRFAVSQGWLQEGERVSADNRDGVMQAYMDAYQDIVPQGHELIQ